MVYDTGNPGELMNKDQIYHKIALACLKTLREGKSANSQDQVKDLYDAIDKGFEEQFSLLVQELDETKARLDAIARLNPEKHNLEDARAIIFQQKISH